MEVKMNGAKHYISVLTKVSFIERWPSYRVATLDRFHCMFMYGGVIRERTYPESLVAG